MPTFKVVAYPQPADEDAQRPRLTLVPTQPTPKRPLRNITRKVETRRGQSEDAVEQQLISEGYQVASIKPIERVASWRTKYRREKIVLYRQLARVVRKSNMINLTTDFLPMFSPTSAFREHAHDFLRAIESQPIYKAMSAKPAVFADYEVNIMEAGANGNESEMLEMLSNSLKAEVRVGRWAKQLAVYPLILFAMIAGCFGAYYGIALPRLLANVHNYDYSALPPIMRLVMLPTHIFASPAATILATLFLALAIATTIFIYLFVPAVQYGLEYALLTMTGPYGKILITSLQLRFLRTLQLMLQTGLQDRAYDIIQGIAVGRVATAALRRVRVAYEEGQSSWAHAMYFGGPLLDRPLVGRIIAAEKNDATIGMTTELGEVMQEKEQDGDILFEDLKVKLNSTMILIFAIGIMIMYLSLYATDQFFLTHTQ
jgi:type II secretory pathway component PulF